MCGAAAQDRGEPGTVEALNLAERVLGTEEKFLGESSFRYMDSTVKVNSADTI